MLNNKIKILIAFFLLVCEIAFAFAVELSTHIDRDSIHQGETFRLNIISNQRLKGSPDLRVLEKDFFIVSNAHSQQLTVINGQETITTQWTVELTPRRTGKLIIPALSVGGAHTEPLSIQILPRAATTSAPKSSAKVFMVTTVTPKQVYVQSQIIYTIRVYYTDPIQNAELTEPRVANALIMPLGEDKNYQTMQGNKGYAVFERNYVIYPRQSGSLKIYSPVLTGTQLDDSVNNVRSASFDTVMTNSKAVRVTSNTLSVNVEPPAKLPANTSWLPAQQITLSETWDPTTSPIKVGVPITRTITINAQGLSAEQLPSLTPETSKNIKIYAEKPQLNNLVQNGMMNGQRIEKMTYIPTAGGKVTLAAIRLPWWNVKTRQWQTAVLPARTIHVEDEANTAQNNMAATVSTVATTSDFEKPWPLLILQSAVKWIIVSVILLIMILYFLIKSLPRKNIRPTVPDQENCLKQLRSACVANDASRTKIALLQWAQLQWPNQRIIYLSDIAKQINVEALKNALRDLDTALYAQQAMKNWQGKPLWQALQNFLYHRNKKTSIKKSDLPPLNPTNKN